MRKRRLEAIGNTATAWSGFDSLTDTFSRELLQASWILEKVRYKTNIVFSEREK